MEEIKTVDDVLDNARAFFETAPWLADLALALCQKDRVCRVSMNLTENGEVIHKVAWPAKEGAPPLAAVHLKYIGPE